MYRNAVFTLLVASASILTGCKPKPDLPAMFPVPNTVLISEQGKPVSLGEMKGNVTVYDFIYTRCTTTCPMMTQAMRKLTQRIDKDAPVRFVSISVDPGYDTPAVLQKYAATFRNDPRWTFLTGDKDKIIKLSVEGFKLAAGPPPPGTELVLHSSRFVVADKQGMIRETYGATDGDAPEHVSETVKALLEE